jgi:hypothetical protein
MRYRVPATVLKETFDHFRRCGGGRRECQVVWISAWRESALISAAVHPQHAAHGGGFRLDDAWLNDFWQELARKEDGIRVQIHTHPRRAFHSRTDDAYPIIHQPGFLSLVIPDFAMGVVGFERAYLAEIGDDGRWREVAVADRIDVT